MEELDLTHDSHPFIDEDPQFRALVSEEYLAGETVGLWSTREHYRRQMNIQRAEVLKAEAVLGELLFRMKRKLARLGRNGAWSAWLKQNKISRAAADRLVLGYAEPNGLRDELPSREVAEPHEGSICISAHRASERVAGKLQSSRSRMMFLSCLADLLNLSVDWDADIMQLRILPRGAVIDPETYAVPNLIEVQNDGTIRPVDFELRDEDGADFPL
jgi:hypothetical protein